tara:strand:+ start:674 stop:2110 length:1437 start_codon:yes stop_codon:yes gene_type:complete
LLYQIFILNIFGASSELDIYFASNTINFIIVAVSLGAMNFAITPIFIKYYKNNEKKKLGELASSLFNFILVSFFLIALFQYLFAPNILHLILPGFKEADLEVAIQLFRIQAFLSIVSVVTALLLALHYTFNLFYRTIIFPIIAQGAQILFVWFFYEKYGIFSLVYGLAISQCLTFILFSFPFVKFYKLRIDFNSELKETSRKIFPLILSSSFSKSNIIVDRFFASTLSAGSITMLQYGEKIIRIISDFINKGISLVSLRKFSLEQNNEKEFQRLFYLIYKTMIFILVPVSIIIIFYLRDALNVIVLSNKISNEDIDKLYLVIIAFIGVLIGGSLNSTITNAFYAKGLTNIVAKVDIILQIFGIIMKIGLFFILGFWGLPIAFSVTSIIGAFTLFFLYNKHIYSFDFKILFNYILKIIIIGTLSIFFPLVFSKFIIEFWAYKLIINLVLYCGTFILLTFMYEKDISYIIYKKLNSIRKK